MGERKRPGSIAQTIGGVLVGFDEQTWSRRPPAQERVAQVGRLATIVTPGGLTIELPASGAGAPSGPDRDVPDREEPDRDVPDREEPDRHGPDHDGADRDGADRPERATTG